MRSGKFWKDKSINYGRNPPLVDLNVATDARQKNAMVNNFPISILRCLHWGRFRGKTDSRVAFKTSTVPRWKTVNDSSIFAANPNDKRV